MKPANTKEYYLHLCGHLWDGGEVENKVGGRVDKEHVNWHFVFHYPQEYTIIERPMVYVYIPYQASQEEIDTGKTVYRPVTTAQLKGDSIEFYLDGIGDLACSFPIEEQTNA